MNSLASYRRYTFGLEKAFCKTIQSASYSAKITQHALALSHSILFGTCLSGLVKSQFALHSHIHCKVYRYKTYSWRSNLSFNHTSCI